MPIKNTKLEECVICEKEVYFSTGSVIMKKKEICKDCRNTIVGLGKFEEKEVSTI